MTNQLKVTVKDNNGQVLNNREQQISVVLEFQPAYERNNEAAIDREFVTSAKKFANFNEFS